ncbi:hypothetical protein QR98_0095340 [Sarcoptes scabiei]|uniref:Uncharacterized protein n=1 Tax=Sarcoptes scabiei TaxID=52283 RepID=A0A132AJI0_SARSC|nr:hypothetical protein QR98_0095340 [Sarcoptes scabiei]
MATPRLRNSSKLLLSKPRVQISELPYTVSYIPKLQNSTKLHLLHSGYRTTVNRVSLHPGYKTPVYHVPYFQATDVL